MHSEFLCVGTKYIVPLNLFLVHWIIEYLFPRLNEIIFVVGASSFQNNIDYHTPTGSCYTLCRMLFMLFPAYEAILIPSSNWSRVFYVI